MTFRTGDVVRITFRGKTVTGEVLLASESGLSMTLLFEESLGIYNGLMPVLWLGEGFVDLLQGEPVLISPVGA